MGQQVTNNEFEVRCLSTDLRIEQRDAETVSRTITGYAAKFDVWSEPIMGWFREKIAPGAFSGCDLEDVIMCISHRDDAILSRTMSGTLQLAVDEVGLRFSFEAPNTTLGNDMLELVRRGDISKCSFRFGVAEDAWVYTDEQNGLDTDERTILKFSRVVDVSLVVFPAYPDTEASVRHLEERKAEWLKAKEPHPDAERVRYESLSRKRLVETLNLK
ncbi:HK97 family phage prohead protease [Alistipes sp.]|uniref:HK97 family phage prohead protease n=1 Tax=Alistipes sp. TaxID=1872444 RepID=UPI003AF0CD2E